MEREIMIGDLVRLAERTAVKHNFPRNIGVVIDFVGLQNTGWSDPNEVCAKIQWMGGSQTITGFDMLELAKQ
jgi:hypothetical protein